VRFTTRVLLTLVFIALYAGAFPPSGIPLLAWIAPVPYLIALRGARVGVALFLGWLSAFVVAVWITDFLPRAITTYYEQSPVFGAILFTVVVTVMCCPFHMLFSAWYARLQVRKPVRRILLVGAAWAAAEYGRGVVGGNPWGLFAYSQADSPGLIQIADLAGPYGVGFVLLATGAALAQITDGWRAARASLIVAGLLLAAVLGYGALRLEDASRAAGPTVEVAVIQPNLDLGFQWRPELLGANLNLQLDLTVKAHAASKARLVVWPESALTFFIEREPTYRALMGYVLKPRDLQLVVGGVRPEGGAFYNAAFVVEPDGRVSASYDKEWLVPFAEYFPFRTVGWLNRRFGRVKQFTPGTRTDPLPTVAGPAAVVICNEALLPEVVRDRVRRGGALIVNLANDGWLGAEAFSHRVLDVTVFRAVETRRYVLRASTSGTSSIIDPWGRVLVEASPFVQTFVSAPVQPSTVTTPYMRFGDLFAQMCVLVVLVELTTRRVRARRSARA
jgi:apolipoprotein N-acyltransferase